LGAVCHLVDSLFFLTICSGLHDIKKLYLVFVISEKNLLKYIRNTILVFVFLGFRVASSQDISFSQFYANPLYLNPAFSGSVGIPRIALQYRDQWSGFGNAFTTYSAAFDMPVKKLQGGIGG